MGNEVVSYEEMLKNAAKEAANVEKPAGTSISVRSGVLQYNGSAVQGNKLDCIIVSSRHSNLYYEGKFNPNALTNPVCFAYSPDGENMAPHSESSKPQAENCHDCPKNQWGSDPDGGRGKACKNSRSLGLLPANLKPEEVAKSEVAVLKLPVMSVKNWQNYHQECLALYGIPPIGFVTQISTVPDAKSQFKVTFTNVAKVEKEVGINVFSRIKDVNTLLEHVYDPNPELTEEKPGKTKKF